MARAVTAYEFKRLLEAGWVEEPAGEAIRDDRGERSRRERAARLAAAERAGSKQSRKQQKAKGKQAKRIGVDERRRSQSVWTVSGGGFESNRRRH